MTFIKGSALRVRVRRHKLNSDLDYCAQNDALPLTFQIALERK